MKRMHKGELQEAARLNGINPDRSYNELREALDIKTCDFCGSEFVTGWTDRFCSDACEVQYINEHFR